MAEPRPFPPSPRRLALARAAGLTSASPVLVGAAGAAALALVIPTIARAAAHVLGGWTVSAVGAADGHVAGSLAPPTPTGAAGATVAGSASHAVGPAGTPLALPRVTLAALDLILPLLAVAALAALVMHVAQTRALWLPRRARLPGAPAPRRPGTARAALDMLAATVIGVVCVGWLFQTAPQLATLVQRPTATGLALASLLATLAIAWLGAGVADALVRSIELRHALAMTRSEKRDDDRLAAADPRWAAQRQSLGRTSPLADAVARAALLVLGDDIAVAIAWDPVRSPVPLVVATGRRAQAFQLLGLARRHRVPVQRESALAARLAKTGDALGPVPASEWSTLAPLVAAVRR